MLHKYLSQRHRNFEKKKKKKKKIRPLIPKASDLQPSNVHVCETTQTRLIPNNIEACKAKKRQSDTVNLENYHEQITVKRLHVVTHRENSDQNSINNERISMSTDDENTDKNPENDNMEMRNSDSLFCRFLQSNTTHQKCYEKYKKTR